MFPTSRLNRPFFSVFNHKLQELINFARKNFTFQYPDLLIELELVPFWDRRQFSIKSQSWTSGEMIKLMFSLWTFSICFVIININLDWKSITRWKNERGTFFLFTFIRYSFARQSHHEWRHFSAHLQSQSLSYIDSISLSYGACNE